MSDWTKYKEKVRNTNPEIGKDIDEVEEVSVHFRRLKYMVDKGELRLAVNRAIDSIEGEWIDLIHCADCKWFQCNMQSDGTLPRGVDEYECRHWCGSCDPFDFCSYGERLNLNE